MDSSNHLLKQLKLEVTSIHNSLSIEVLQQVEFLESTARKLGEFAERARAVETPLQRCEERLTEALSAPPAVAAEAVARLSDQIHALRAPLQVCTTPGIIFNIISCNLFFTHIWAWVL